MELKCRKIFLTLTERVAWIYQVTGFLLLTAEECKWNNSQLATKWTMILTIPQINASSVQQWMHARTDTTWGTEYILFKYQCTFIHGLNSISHRTFNLRRWLLTLCTKHQVTLELPSHSFYWKTKHMKTDMFGC